ncbi:hypothetical protein GE21DRAFT_1312580 [Neurospora crassa]|nr:hypothetical protein GE21DRAFT_1312580 [Neurospora crassa]
MDRDTYATIAMRTRVQPLQVRRKRDRDRPCHRFPRFVPQIRHHNAPNIWGPGSTLVMTPLAATPFKFPFGTAA